jgi:putative oxidoreductase
MKRYQDISTFFLRIALASGFLSAVASRLNLWGKYSSGWTGFLSYTAKVNSFAPSTLVPFIAILSTCIETALAILLLLGYKTRLAAAASSILTLVFALAMAYSFGIKEPLDYSVFVFSASGMLLATVSQYPWSIDKKINSKK